MLPNKDQYLAEGGVFCPYCHSQEISGSFVEINGPRAWQTMHCIICGKHWTDIYMLSDVEEET